VLLGKQSEEVDELGVGAAHRALDAVALLADEK